MATPDFRQRFDELIKQAEHIETTKRLENGQYGNFTRIDANLLLNWKVKAKHLLEAVCGSDSQHFKLFSDNEATQAYDSNYDIFCRLRAVFLAAKEDYEGGYLSSIKVLIQSDLFDSELERAQELYDAGYLSAAAVIAGVVLETGLREWCGDHGIAVGKLDKMNVDLARVGAYSKLRQKQITALADIRNAAAHGETNRFNANDVASMIREVRNLLADRS